MRPRVDPNDASAYTVAADWLCAGTGGAGLAVTTACPVAVPIAANEISIRVPRNNERRPDARYGQNLQISNGSSSWYHAGQLEFESGYWRGLNGRMTYTFSKTIDEGSEATFVGTGDTNIFPDDDQYKRGLSRFDTRHRFTMSSSYELPFFKNSNNWLLKGALGGWQVSTLVRLASGTPFSIIDSGAVDFDFDGITANRPVCIDPSGCGGYTINYPGNSQTQLSRGSFRRAGYGDNLDDLVERNNYYLDGKENIDLGVYKTFFLPGDVKLMIRGDAFNVFDKVTWGFPDNNWANTTTFGRLASLNYTPRIIQVGFRLIY